MTVPLRIAFDLDGVLADMEGELVRQADILFGRPMPRGAPERGDSAAETPSANLAETPPDSDASPSADETAPDKVPVLRMDLSPRQLRKLWHHVGSIENFWQSLNETEPGIVARLAAAASDRRWDIIFLTKRPGSAGATAQLQTQRWLESKGFELPSVYVVQGSRGRIAAALGLDVVVDDRPENCLDVVVDSKARAILVWRDGDQQLPGTVSRLGIGVVKSVGECLDILTQVGRDGEQSPGVIDRVKRLLGLKQAAGA
jgi:hypothetical protein